MRLCEFKIKINYNDVEKFTNVAIKTAKVKQANTANVDASLESIKQRVLDSTEEYINDHRKRPSANQHEHIIDVLRETSFIEKVDNTTWRLNIGNQKELDSRVPYWRIVNYGGKADVSKIGIFADGRPQAGKGGQPFYEGGTDGKGASYLMIPKKPIPPMHYLNHMAHEFVRAIRKYK